MLTFELLRHVALSLYIYIQILNKRNLTVKMKNLKTLWQTKSLKRLVHIENLYLGLDATKHVFGVSEKARLKQVYSATKTS